VNRRKEGWEVSNMTSTFGQLELANLTLLLVIVPRAEQVGGCICSSLGCDGQCFENDPYPRLYRRILILVASFRYPRRPLQSMITKVVQMSGKIKAAAASG
jgi:hypothetical protein